MPIDPTPDAVQRFLDADTGPFVMVQLLRFAAGGREKYLEYSASAQPILLRLGAQILYAGECKDPFVAQGEPWDAIVVIRYPKRATYLELLADAQYQGIVHLRKQAVRDAMLLPMDDWDAR